MNGDRLGATSDAEEAFLSRPPRQPRRAQTAEEEKKDQGDAPWRFARTIKARALALMARGSGAISLVCRA